MITIAEQTVGFLEIAGVVEDEVANLAGVVGLLPGAGSVVPVVAVPRPGLLCLGGTGVTITGAAVAILAVSATSATRVTSTTATAASESTATIETFVGEASTSASTTSGVLIAAGNVLLNSQGLLLVLLSDDILGQVVHADVADLGDVLELILHPFVADDFL